MLKDLGPILREIREKRGLTQRQLAGTVRLTPQAVSSIERGITIPSLSVLANIASALDTTLPLLLERALQVPDRERRELVHRLSGIALTMSPATLELAIDLLEVIARRDTSKG